MHVDFISTCVLRLALSEVSNNGKDSDKGVLAHWYSLGLREPQVAKFS
jgi:hypothetical protein